MTAPLATLGPTILDTGITAPSYADILESLIASMQDIYGSDVYLAPDSQDGQLLALVASAINDCNNAAIAIFNSFSPTFAQGIALSSMVKINGIRRLASSQSSAIGTVTGVAGTTINNGSVADINGNIWDLPASVFIPGAGFVSVTVTAQEQGILVAPAGSINTINSPTFGWQSFVSTSDAIPGAAVESDAELRQRQTLSVALSSVTPLSALTAALGNLPGVSAVRVYENATTGADSNGLPPHSIAPVVGGGVLQDIVDAIGARKTPGATTYGTTAGTYTDPLTSIPYTINFFAEAQTTIRVNITVKAGNGYSTIVSDKIKAALAAYINGVGIGNPVQYSRLFPAAYLNGDADGARYEVTALTIALGIGGSFGTADLPLVFNSGAVCDPNANIALTVT